MSWAKGHDRCKSCGTEELNHKARGLCTSCYDAAAEKRHKSHVTRRIGSHLPIPITKEDLEQKYKSGLSLNDIARQYDCTRQYIHKLLKQYDLGVRTKSEARSLALQQGKISYSSNVYSPGTTITHEKRLSMNRFSRRGRLRWPMCLASSIRMAVSLNRLARSSFVSLLVRRNLNFGEGHGYSWDSNARLRVIAQHVGSREHLSLSALTTEDLPGPPSLGLTAKQESHVKVSEIPPV